MNIPYEIQILQNTVLNDFHRHLFHSSKSSHAATSVVNMKNGGLCSGPKLYYAENSEVDGFADKIVITWDSHASNMVDMLANFYAKGSTKETKINRWPITGPYLVHFES